MAEELTVYPDAHEETTSVDGNVNHTESNRLFSDLVTGAG
ncbi:unnamed protein product, partial [marine sediment metagenome]